MGMKSVPHLILSTIHKITMESVFIPIFLAYNGCLERLLYNAEFLKAADLQDFDKAFFTLHYLPTSVHIKLTYLQTNYTS